MSPASSKSPARWQRSHKIAAAAVGLAVLLLVLALPYAAGYGSYRRTMWQLLSDAWFNSQDSTWQHGALAPFIAGYLVWLKRHELAALPLRPSAWGFGILMIAMVAYFIGYKANSYYFGAIALQLMPAGAVLALMGWRQMRVLLFPWCILAFTWPVRFMEDTLGFQLRFIMVRCVAVVLQVLHAPIWKDGTTLLSAPSSGHEIGDWLKLNVDGPCSGMRTLFALMLVSALFAYFRQYTWGRRIALFATSIPLAIAGNMVRLFLLIGGSALFGQSVAVGNHETEVTTFHFMAGVAVFIIAVAGMQGISALMDLWLPKTKLVPRAAPQPAISQPMGWMRPATVLGLSVATMLVCWFSPSVQTGDEAGVVMNLPQRVPSFLGQPEKPAAEETNNLPEDTTIAKMLYSTAGSGTGEGDRVHVSLVLAGSERRSIHRPEVCLPGQGWSIVGSEVVPVEITPGKTLRVKDLTIEKTGHNADGSATRIRAHYVYWFIGTDITTPSHFERIQRTTWDSIVRNVNHRWAYASVMTLVTEDLDPKDTHERHRTDEQTKRLMSFLVQQLVPRFQKEFMPHPIAKS
ncbi:MAG: Exosortase [Verrucomicrobiaceae bacterium]|nr:Exosortase [Verrucomicrobiaceae bacterium]